MVTSQAQGSPWVLPGPSADAAKLWVPPSRKITKCVVSQCSTPAKKFPCYTEAKIKYDIKLVEMETSGFCILETKFTDWCSPVGVF